MTSPTTHLRVGGVWLCGIAAVGDIEVTHRQNGPDALSWTMPLRNNERPRCLKRNAWTEVFAGPRRVWSGPFSQPDWDAGEFAAVGIARQAEGAECLTATEAVTSKPNTAIDQAIARGVVNWVRVGDFGNTDLAGPEGDSSNDDPDPGKLDELLNLWAIEDGRQWRVTPDRRLLIAAEDESNPTLFLIPGTGELGVTDEALADRVFVSYRNSTTGRIRNVSHPASTPAGGIERRTTIVHRGAMSAARATSIAEGMWRNAQSGRTSWTNGVEATAGQLLTRGSEPANLALVRGGQTVRMLGAPDPRNGRNHTDFVLGESIWRPAEKRIQLNPVGLVARTWEQIMSEFNAKPVER